MTQEISKKYETEHQFNQFVVSQYLKHGSVDEVFRANNYDLPMSYPGVHRILNKWGIIKAAGPNSTLSECLAFFTRLAEEEIPLERLYKKMPPSFTPSLATLHRIYGSIKREVKKNLEDREPRRYGTALVISPYYQKEKVLLAKDVSTPRVDLGKPFGSISLPMGFSKKSESREDSILRVLQQEVFTKNVVEKTFPHEVVTENSEPFMYLDIADVRVGVYSLRMPKRLSYRNCYSSYKLKDFGYTDVCHLIETGGKNTKMRTGLVDIAEGYNNYINNPPRNSLIPIYDSRLNISLTALAFDYTR